MAKYTIKHKCGCTVDHQIYGTNVHGERDRKIAWFESVPCMACKNKADIADVTEANALVALTGSPKQIAWAEKIRTKWIINLDADYPGLLAKEDLRPALMAAVNTVATSAKIWIDNRDKLGKGIKKDMEIMGITEQMILDNMATIKAARDAAEKKEEEKVEAPEAPAKKMAGREMAAAAMRRAWAIRRKLHGKNSIIGAEWSAILKQAWADVKAGK